MNQIEIIFFDELKRVNLNLSTEIVNKLKQYLALVLETNKVFNLTAITDFDEALIKHIYDSIVILNYPEYQTAQTILDIGSGAGLPSIPLAICSPHKKFISIDATQKKIKFQEQVCQTLQILNLQPVWSRAEDYISTTNQFQKFDLGMARAVAPVNILAELTLPYIRINGYVILYKGKDYQVELQAGTNAISLLGGSVCNIHSIELPHNYGTRANIIIQKIKGNPKGYPRKTGVPQKKPL